VFEYELVESGRALAVTLMRAVGTLAKPAPRYRPNVAGPAVAVPDAQMPGPRVFRHVVAPGGDPWRIAEDAWVPLLCGRSHGRGHLAGRGSRLTVSGGAEVTSVTRNDGLIELRVFNPASRPTRVEVPGRSGFLVDLAGRVDPSTAWRDGFDLGPHRIATARLDGRSLD
jgi:alpha-mannosidase